MGKGGGGSSSGYGGSEEVKLAPVQLGAETNASSFRPEWFDSALNGLYTMMKDTVSSTYESLGGAKGIGSKLAGFDAGLQEYEDRMGQIADTMMVSFAQNVTPDSVMTFPLDEFVTSSIKDIYQKSSDIFTNPTLSRSELKTMIDSNLGNLTTQFAQRRRTLEQEIQARGLSGPAAAAARESAELDIARSKEGVARTTLATEFANKKTTQLNALSSMSNASAMGQSYTSQLSSRWLDQWKTKLSAEGLRQSGLQVQLGALTGAAGVEQQQWGNLFNTSNNALTMGQNFLSGVNAQSLDEYGKHVAAYGGAGSSSSWTSEDAKTAGSYSMPGFSWSNG
jgi:hypothetical protein